VMNGRIAESAEKTEEGTENGRVAMKGDRSDGVE